MKKYVMLSIILCTLGCTGQSQEEEPPPLKKVEVIQTEQFVTFYGRYADISPTQKVELVQKAAEQWMLEHPEYVAKDMSTSQNGHTHFTFCMTLRVEKK